jgi:thiamine transporter
MKTTKKLNLYWLVESAIMIALAIVLEMVSKSIIPKMAFGGQITIVSMLPVVLVGWKYGIGKGIVTGFVYSLAEMVIGLADGTITAAFLPPEEDGLGIGKAILMLFLDYILAYTVIGLSGMFRQKGEWGWICGTIMALLIRFVCHFTSGVVIFHSAGKLWEGFTTENTLLYSFIYNISYMLPEIAFTCIGTFVFFKAPAVKKIITAK